MAKVPELLTGITAIARKHVFPIQPCVEGSSPETALTKPEER